MRRRGTTGWLAALAVLLAAPAAAYLPSPAELRTFWEDQRPLEAPLYLRYDAAAPSDQRLEIYLRPDGLWAKRVAADDGPVRTTWKWGRGLWQDQDGRWRTGTREQAAWDDWAFEPLVDVLLWLTPREILGTRGLGRHPQGYLWLYGARHDAADGTWFGLFKQPIRLGVWHSQNAAIGSVEFFYGGDHRYPDRIVFRRNGHRDFVLHKRDVVWGAEATAKGFSQPEIVDFRPELLPARVLVDDRAEEGDDAASR